MGDDDGAGQPDAGDRPDRPDGAVQKKACDQMDILFVVDDSQSMELEQTNLGMNFPSFVSVLEDFRNSDGDPIDYHVGVTTTGVTKDYFVDGLFGPVPASQTGADGNLVTGSNCMMPRRYLERTDDGVADKFSCVASVGIDGPTSEMPLEASRLALTSRVSDGANAGFLRDDALLAVVMLTDENDCSRTDDGFTIGAFDLDMCGDLEPVTTYVDAFDTVKGGRDRWAAAVIAGVGPGPCNSALGDADEATRLLDFAEMGGDNVVTSSICDGDLASGLGDAMAKFQEACNDFGPIVD